MVRAAGREEGKDGRRERGSATTGTPSAAHLFPFDPRARGTIPPVTTGTGGISYIQRQSSIKQVMPGRPTACLRRLPAVFGEARSRQQPHPVRGAGLGRMERAWGGGEG